jgi:hypothetical protein
MAALHCRVDRISPMMLCHSPAGGVTTGPSKPCHTGACLALGEASTVVRDRAMLKNGKPLTARYWMDQIQLQ